MAMEIQLFGLGAGFMRMNIATPRKNVMQAMKQLAAALKA